MGQRKLELVHRAGPSAGNTGGSVWHWYVFRTYDSVSPCIIAAIDDHTECAGSQWRCKSRDREVAWEAMPQSARRRGFDPEAMPPA
jgi:hypothetical protein